MLAYSAMLPILLARHTAALGVIGDCWWAVTALIAAPQARLPPPDREHQAMGQSKEHICYSPPPPLKVNLW